MKSSYAISKFKAILCFLFLAFLMMLMPLTVHAFNLYEEMDKVSKDPGTAYTLYLGMPAKDFTENFRNIPWHKEAYEGGLIFFTRGAGAGIQESISVIVRDDKVINFSVSFFGENDNTLLSLARIAFDNLQRTLGPMQETRYSRHSKTQTNIWYFDGGTRGAIRVRNAKG